MSAIRLLHTFQQVLCITVTALYFYQVVFLAIGLLRRSWKNDHKPLHLRRYAALISARNEEGVIAQLIDSLKRQNYPAGLLDIYVVADNCTDGTARAARAAGAKVYQRRDPENVGKGYALDYLLHRMSADGLTHRYAGYFVFDADNLVDPNFVYEMNRTFDQGGLDAITCYRNSKNFGQNWITAGYSIWFLREARFVNSARMTLGTSCAVSGTGFLVSARLIQENGGWPYYLLTEDIQFSAACAVSGKRIGYCEGAVIYDEQPATFRQAWDQRMRWSKGFYQVDARYGLSLAKGVLRGGRQGFGCYDLLMTILPGVLFTLLGGLLNIIVLVSCLSSSLFVAQYVMRMTGTFLGEALLSYYLGMFFYGLLTVLSEWKHIRAIPAQKLGYLLTFPLFMATYLPISIAAFFRKVEWTPIRHTPIAAPDPAL